MRTSSLMLAAVFCWLCVLTPAWGAPAIPIKDADMTVGVAAWASTMAKPMILAIKQVNPADNTKTITTNVSIPNIPAFVPPAVPAFVKPLPNLGENVFAYQMRVAAAYQQYVANNTAAYVAAWNAASKDKADKIAAAINGTLGAGTATSAAGAANAAGYKPAVVSITNCQSVTHGKKSNTTGEVGDGVRFRMGTPGTSPYPYKSTMGSSSGLFPTAAGTDPLGNSSIVEYGIGGVYVASWFPNQGDSISTVLQGLQSLLEGNSVFTSDGYSAVYDSPTQSLSITGGPGGNFNDGSDTVDWSMTDMAFDGELGVTYGADLAGVADVPEPASLLLVVAGVAAVGLGRRRRIIVGRSHLTPMKRG